MAVSYNPYYNLALLQRQQAMQSNYGYVPSVDPTQMPEDIATASAIAPGTAVNLAAPAQSAIPASLPVSQPESQPDTSAVSPSNAFSFQMPSGSRSAYDTYKIKKNGEMSKLSQGQKADIGMAAISGVANLGLDMATIGSGSLNLGKPSTTYYAEGTKPTYQTGDYFNRAYRARPQGATGMEIASTGLKTAASGAQIGSMIMPGIGTAIGAGIGALVGAGGAGIAGGIRKRRQEREKQRALRAAQKQQEQFNTRALDYSQQQTAQSEYMRRANPYARMSNYYTA